MLADLIGLLPFQLVTLVPLAGVVGGLVGLVLIIRLSNGTDDAPAPWRYRLPSLDSRHRLPRATSVDVRAARRMARALLIAAIAMPAGVVILWVAQPGFIGGVDEPHWFEIALPWVGVAGYLFGLGLMIRIYRADPEPGETTWRYRP